MAAGPQNPGGEGNPPAGGQANPPQTVSIPVSGTAGIGNVNLVPPTFLEKWGVVFVSVGGIWILLVCVGVLIYYLSNLSLPPPLASGQKPDDYKSLLDLHKTAGAQFQDSVVFVFDLMVTKTILPLLTLLLGYLFGAKKSQ